MPGYGIGQARYPVPERPDLCTRRILSRHMGDILNVAGSRERPRHRRLASRLADSLPAGGASRVPDIRVIIKISRAGYDIRSAGHRGRMRQVSLSQPEKYSAKWTE